MIEDHEEYLAYLLRLWRTRSGGRWVWRASLESPHTAEHQVFADLEGLVAFLEDKTDICLYHAASGNRDTLPGNGRLPGGTGTENAT